MGQKMSVQAHIDLTAADMTQEWAMKTTNASSDCGCGHSLLLMFDAGLQG